MFDCVVIGRVYADHIFCDLSGIPNLGEELYAPSYRLNVGGGAAITGCWLAGAGRSVALVGCIGADDRRFFSQTFASFNLNYAAVLWCDGRSGITCALSTVSDRAFVTYTGVNELLEAYVATNVVLDLVRDARHVHITVPLGLRVGRAVTQAARSAGATVSLDVGFQPSWYASAEGSALVKAVDYFLPNEREARCLVGADSSVPIGEVVAKLRRWRDYGAHERRLLVVKLGAEGAAVDGVDGIEYVANGAAQVVDTTGAGDAFDAGLIDGLLGHLGAVAAVRRGCVFGASSVEVAGGIPTPEKVVSTKMRESNRGS